MPPLLIVILIAVVAVLLAGLAYYLLVTTEGVYLGQRVVTWLYDLYAPRYDRIKQFQPDYERILLARPILGEIGQDDPLVLDVATGSGRLPLALCQYEYFEGRIIATDISRRMLDQAAATLAAERERVTLLRCAGERLPFPDATFDVVTCLEALEFMADPAGALRECVRVLRPGGLLLITNRRKTWMPGRIWSDDDILARLAACGVHIAQIEPWQVDYHKVWGMKDLD